MGNSPMNESVLESSPLKSRFLVRGLAACQRPGAPCAACMRKNKSHHTTANNTHKTNDTTNTVYGTNTDTNTNANNATSANNDNTGPGALALSDAAKSACPRVRNKS